jgi:hypothetical protein
MKKTATILALASLSMASNPEHVHGSLRTRKIVDHKPLVDSSVTFKPQILIADDELQIIRMDGGSSYNGDPRFAPKTTTKPSTWTPPTNPKVWTPPKEDVRLYADDVDDELQILRMDTGSRYNGDPRFAPKATTKPSTWTPPINPKYLVPRKEDFRLYADDADDELQILRMDTGSRYNGDPRFAPKPTTKPSTWTPPTNPKVWIPRKDDVRLYADDADDELQIIRMDTGSRYNGDPRFAPKTTTKPSTWTPPINPKYLVPRKDDVRLYADDADDELQILRVDGGSRYNGDPRFAPKPTTKPSTWTPPTNPKVWTPPKEDVRLYADDADDELIALAELLNL